MMARNKRKHPRLDRALPAEIVLPDGTCIQAVTLDLSRTGLLLLCDALAAPALLPDDVADAASVGPLRVRLLNPINSAQPLGFDALYDLTRWTRLEDGDYELGLKLQGTRRWLGEGDMQQLDTDALVVPERWESEARRIVEQVHNELPDQASRALLFTGVIGGEGVSTVAWWLAVYLASDPKLRVCYISPGFRGTLDARLLEQCINEPTPPQDEIAAAIAGPQRRIDRTANLVKIAPSMKRGAARSSSSSSDTLADFEPARQHCDYVIIDAAPVGASPFTLNLARAADGVFLVLESGKTDVKRAAVVLEELRGAGARVLGAVLNLGSPENNR